MKSAWGDADLSRAFYELTPDRVLAAVEASGSPCTGYCSALGSYENRVYEVELDDFDVGSLTGAAARIARRRVVKFYRPGRWSEEQIREEHLFLADLLEAEVPAVAPLPFPDGDTLRLSDGIWYSVFPKVGGRSPDELSPDQLSRMGRLLARMHAVGSRKPGAARIQLTAETYGYANLEYLAQSRRIPPEHASRFEKVARSVCERARERLSGVPIQRVHGDCHLGNLLWNEKGPFFLDFDDMVRGPVAQDLWLLIPGRDREAQDKFEILLSAYEEMRDFDRSQLRLFECLRALRFIHYAAWIARRWEDPAFPRAFPQFESPRYWADLCQDLEDQLALLA